MAVLILMSAYFSATETAFSSLNKTRLKTRAEKGSRRAAATLKLAEDYDKLLSTILIGKRGRDALHHRRHHRGADLR